MALLFIFTNFQIRLSFGTIHCTPLTSKLLCVHICIVMPNIVSHLLHKLSNWTVILEDIPADIPCCNWSKSKSKICFSLCHKNSLSIFVSAFLSLSCCCSVEGRTFFSWQIVAHLFADLNVNAKRFQNDEKKRLKIQKKISGYL